MSTLERRSLTCTALAALSGLILAISASGASSIKITNCTTASSRPKNVTLTCGDGNTVLSGLRWSSFGGTSASAKGTFKTNTCEPNCAEGKLVSYPVSARASNPRDCKGGVRVYNKLTLRFTSRAPAARKSLKHWTLGCPI